MSHFLLIVKVISVHTASNCYTWCLVWQGGAAVLAEENFLLIPALKIHYVFLRLEAYVTFIKPHSTEAHVAKNRTM